MKAHLLALDAVDQDKIVALPALYHLALHLPQPVSAGSSGLRAYFAQLTGFFQENTGCPDTQ